MQRLGDHRLHGMRNEEPSGGEAKYCAGQAVRRSGVTPEFGNKLTKQYRNRTRASLTRTARFKTRGSSVYGTAGLLLWRVPVAPRV